MGVPFACHHSPGAGVVKPWIGCGGRCFDVPEIDGNFFLDAGFEALSPGDIVTVEPGEASAYDLWGRLISDA